MARGLFCELIAGAFQKFAKLTAGKMFTDVDTLRFQIAIIFPQDIVFTGLVEIGCNPFLGAGFDRHAVDAQLFNSLITKQFVATHIYLEI